MDKTQRVRQKKYQDGMHKMGKKQRTYYLSDEAVAVILQHKQDTQAQNQHLCLEHILFTFVTDKEQLEIQKVIMAQARCTSNAYRDWQANRAPEAANKLTNECKKLALLIDPSPIVEKSAKKVETKKTVKPVGRSNVNKSPHNKWLPNIILNWWGSS